MTSFISAEFLIWHFEIQNFYLHFIFFHTFECFDLRAFHHELRFLWNWKDEFLIISSFFNSFQSQIFIWFDSNYIHIADNYLRIQFHFRFVKFHFSEFLVQFLNIYKSRLYQSHDDNEQTKKQTNQQKK